MHYTYYAFHNIALNFCVGLPWQWFSMMSSMILFLWMIIPGRAHLQLRVCRLCRRRLLLLLQCDNVPWSTFCRYPYQISCAPVSIPDIVHTSLEEAQKLLIIITTVNYFVYLAG